VKGYVTEIGYINRTCTKWESTSSAPAPGWFIEAEGSKKRYRITDKGRAFLDENLEAVAAIFARLSRAGERMARWREAFGQAESEDGGGGAAAAPGRGGDRELARDRVERSRPRWRMRAPHRGNPRPSGRRTEAAVGTMDPSGIRHQFGSSHLPQRQCLWPGMEPGSLAAPQREAISERSAFLEPFPQFSPAWPSARAYVSPVQAR
jgi:hypothetical protein